MSSKPSEKKYSGETTDYVPCFACGLPTLRSRMVRSRAVRTYGELVCETCEARERDF